jgi:hypothetical protein
MIKKLILSIVFGYYKVSYESQPPVRALRSAKTMASFFLTLLLFNILFLLAPAFILDSLGVCLLTSAIGWGIVFYITSDQYSWRAMQIQLDNYPRSLKIAFSALLFLALPCLCILLLYTMSH